MMVSKKRDPLIFVKLAEYSTSFSNIFDSFCFHIETRDILVNFLRDARQRYPIVFNQVTGTNPEQAQYAVLL